MPHVRTAALVLCLTLVSTVARAELPRALPVGTLPDDARIAGELRTLNSYFPMKKVDTPEQWKARVEELRRRIRVANGLWPWPTKTPLNAVVHGKVERDGYTVERVFFESVPGHYVTGSLYRPLNDHAIRDGKRPVVLCPHGHWSKGRFYDAGEGGTRRQIAIGAERFEQGGRSPLQARCVGLARMGCVVFHYDMLSYADSIQFTGHRPGHRPDTVTEDAWTFGSPPAELHLQNVMGLQTWNSVRALDFVLTLDEVDPSRVAVTGGSGGGTQTMLLAAIDDRVDLSFPAVMVSTAMQGGCNCENAPYLRIDNGNIDIAALAAAPSKDHPHPRPLGMIAADDWTVELETKGLPALRELYKMLGRDPKSYVVAGLHTQFKHNYNAVNRVIMYDFLNKHFKLGHREPCIEDDYTPLSRDELTVWTDAHPKPTGDKVGASHEQAVTKWMTTDTDTQLGNLDDDRFREVVGGAWDTIINRKLSDVGEALHELKEKAQRPGYLEMTGLIYNDERDETVPVLWLYPGNWNGHVVLWITDTGKAGLLNDDGSPRAAVFQLVSSGYAVAGIDMLGQGEFTNTGEPAASQRLVKYGNGKSPWHHYAAYTFGYNPSLFAQRVHDTLGALWMIQHHPRKPKHVHLIGIGAHAGPIALAARAQSGDAVDRLAVDTRGFDFASCDRIDHPMFVPGALKYAGVPGLIRLNKGEPTWAARDAKIADDQNADAAAVEWLMR